MNLQDVRDLDRNDPLASKRQEFVLPGNMIYLDGNSLGALPVAAKQRSEQVVKRQWGEDLIQSWNTHDWIDLPVTVGEKIAPLLGAGKGQVICCDSTSVNLFKLLSCAMHMQEDRRFVLTQEDNFPADLYIAQGLAQTTSDGQFELKTVADDEIEKHLDESVAVLMLTHVNFRSGKLHDMRRLTELAHARGVLVIWDLAHSAGALPLELDTWGVDFAVGCGYKYLNGGPGAPAFIYAARRHHDNIAQPLSGWMGHKAPFSFEGQYQAAPGVQQFLCGTPPVLSMSVLDAALSVFRNVNMESLRAKSVRLAELFLQLLQANENLQELVLLSPPNSQQRGSQLAFTHPRAYSICQALIDRGIVVDFRAPDTLRIGLAPLYLSYEDIWNAVHILTEIMLNKSYLKEQYSRAQKVT